MDTKQDLSLIPIDDLFDEIGNRLDAFVFHGRSILSRRDGDIEIKWEHHCKGDSFSKIGLAAVLYKREFSGAKLDGCEVDAEITEE